MQWPQRMTRPSRRIGYTSETSRSTPENKTSAQGAPSFETSLSHQSRPKWVRNVASDFRRRFTTKMTGTTSGSEPGLQQTHIIVLTILYSRKSYSVKCLLHLTYELLSIRASLLALSSGKAACSSAQDSLLGLDTVSPLGCIQANVNWES
ncbi:hypothetical protein WMY93_005095 [Mugilogobius chulae]|uniref:Uncharacterized protein n=1 Tax=Mugilogobius chulae TaxID=88201 RepID=A0AAW0PSV1_9GOBI